MTQKIDLIKLKAAAENLEWVCQQYPNDEKVQGLYRGLLPMIEDAKAGRVTQPVADRHDIPFRWAVSGERLFDEYKNPDVEGAYVNFAIEMEGGLSDVGKQLVSEIEAMAKEILERGQSRAITI